MSLSSPRGERSRGCNDGRSRARDATMTSTPSRLTRRRPGPTDVPGQTEAPDRTVARAGAMDRATVDGRPARERGRARRFLERRRVGDDAQDREDAHEHDEDRGEEPEGIHPDHLGRVQFGLLPGWVVINEPLVDGTHPPRSGAPDQRTRVLNPCGRMPRTASGRMTTRSGPGDDGALRPVGLDGGGRVGWRS